MDSYQHVIGELVILFNKEIPINILEFFYNADHIFEIDKSHDDIIIPIKISDLYKSYDDIIKESKIPGLSRFDTKYFPRIDLYYREEETKIGALVKSYDNNKEKILSKDGIKYFAIYIGIDVDSAGFKEVDKLVEYFIQLLKPFSKFTEDNYIGYVYDDYYTTIKEYYFDREKFYKEQKELDYLCKECSKRNMEYSCSNIEFCKRAYKLGCENQIKADFKLESLDNLSSLKTVLENNTEVGN